MHTEELIKSLMVDAWPAQVVEHVTLDLGNVSSKPTLDVQVT